MEENQEINDPDLQDPDQTTDSRYSWDENFQRHVMSLMISDRMFLLQSIDLIKPYYFTNKIHSKICNIVFDFFKKYRVLPIKNFIIQEFKKDITDVKTLVLYSTELNLLFDYFQPGMESRDYLQDKIVFFAKIQSVKKAFHDSLKLIDRAPESEETWSMVYDEMRNAMQTHQNFDIGLDYFKSLSDRYEKKDDDDEKKDRFIFGLDEIDREIGGGGYSRGEIISIVAGSGVGKSVMLACVTANNLLRNKKGLYISLELAEDKVAARMDAILSGLPIQNLFCHKEELFDRINKLNVPKDGVGPLIIKQFSAGTATVNTIRAYVSQLRFNGFEPDFIIIDYVGEMALHPDLKTHESRERIVRELRAMASEENVFVATAMQPNRDGKKDTKGDFGRIDDEHLADSFGQIRPLDGCISLNQNDNEKFLGIGRAYVIKQRDGKSRFTIYLKFDKESLRIQQISNSEYLFTLQKHKEEASDETNIDIVKQNWKPKKDEEVIDGIQGDYESYKEVCEQKCEDN